MPSTLSPLPLEKRLAAYGCTEVIRLDEKLSQPAQLDYLDLLPKQNNHAASLTAVAGHQGTSLLYLIDACGDVKSDAASLAKVSRQLANRSDPAWLGVMQSGSLEIYPIGFHQENEIRPVTEIQADNAAAPFFFQSLVHGTFEENRRLRGTDYVFNKIFENLTETTNAFVPKDGSGLLPPLAILSMAGRALFFRFLIDRKIVLPEELSGRDGICSSAKDKDLKDAFSSAEKAAQTSSWLDETFNGDFLPLISDEIPAENRTKRTAEYLRFYQHTEHLVGGRIFDHLQAILRGWTAVGGDFQPDLELGWEEFNFAHIPVGVLSQVYESFSHRADPRTARDTSVHYTPRTIASLMVDQSFAAVKQPAAAQVLDPACGAGIFEVLAFRRLVRERWLLDNDRPKTVIIQQILYGQLRGFDVSESALRLAALSLYITAIEVNGSPHPPKALKFPRNLRGEVLHRFGDLENTGKSTAFSLGSLGPEVSPDFNGKFDLVIGNPPWTRLREDPKDKNQDEEEESAGKSKTDELNDQFTAIGRRVLADKGLHDLAKHYENPDKNPDLPFLWRATEWAKKNEGDEQGGIIALAMPARLFGRTSGKGFQAWRAILRSMEITGLLNGADLRKTAVWEGMDIPFCVLFARNRVPPPDHRFQYAAPSYECGLNSQGRFRIDYESSQPVSVARIEKQPWILKTLSFGTWLDVEVMEAIENAFPSSLAAIWKKWNRSKSKTGQGYNLSEGLEQMPAAFLAKLKDFERPEMGWEIPYEDLKTFKEKYGKETVYWTKGEDLYKSPLVVIPQSPGQHDQAPRAFLSLQPLSFSQSNYGYSCADHPEAETLAALIYLLSNSTLFSYFCLMTSRRSGFDRQTFNKEEFDALPFPDLEKLPVITKTNMRRLAHRLQNDTVKPWTEINSFIFSLYGLDDAAVQVATDTLFAAASYREAGKAALKTTMRDTSDREEPRAAFITTLHDELEPYFDVCGEHVAVQEADFQPDSWSEPWFFLAISCRGDTVPVNASLMAKAMELANDRGTSRIIVQAPGKRGLLLGLLNQRRWWTITRARLCAQHIIRKHLGAFRLPKDA